MYNYEEDPISFSLRHESNCEKMPYLTMLKNPSEIPGPDPDMDDFHNQISSSLSMDKIKK